MSKTTWLLYVLWIIAATIAFSYCLIYTRSIIAPMMVMVGTVAGCFPLVYWRTSEDESRARS